MRTLRADLASAAREARTTPQPTGARVEPEADVRAASRQRLHEADAALTAFRAELRSELRAQYAAGRLADDAVALLTGRLDELRREVTAALRR
jgi:hypothetical protein